jgi:hypothetical protein
MLLFIIACHQTYVIGRSEYTGKHCVDCDDCGGDNDCGDDSGGGGDYDDSNRCLHCLFMIDPETKQIINLQLKVRMIIIIVIIITINIIITTIIVIIIVTGESTCGHRPQEIV